MGFGYLRSQNPNDLVPKWRLGYLGSPKPKALVTKWRLDYLGSPKPKPLSYFGFRTIAFGLLLG